VPISEVIGNESDDEGEKIKHPTILKSH